MKKLIPHCGKDKEKSAFIIQKITENSVDLAQNPYGNYAIQTAMESFEPSTLFPIIESIKGKYSQLSMLKFSSNVIEKCIEKANLKQREEIVKELTSPDKLVGLLKNNFANFVLQKTLSLIEGDLRREMIKAMEDSLQHINEKKLKMKWVNIIEQESI